MAWRSTEFLLSRRFHAVSARPKENDSFPERQQAEAARGLE